MNFGAAHLCNTSLPISGGDSNAAISAHTGYIGRIFFDNIKHLEYGDEISVRNYFETLDYSVIDKKSSMNTTAEICILKAESSC